MTRSPQDPKPSTGPPRHLIERIEHLQKLLKNLPDTIPLHTLASPSAYHFGLDNEKVEERGTLGALSHCLKINFKTWKGKDVEIKFKERGPSISVALINFMKHAVKEMSPTDWTVFDTAAETSQPSNTTAPEPKRTKTSPPDAIEISSDDKGPMSAKSDAVSKQKQATLAQLGWKPWGKGEKAAHISKEVTKGAKEQGKARD
ncbi:hypothetical protein H0H87_001298 [Tephrocybe sp. NHM501043]|nr:hypothetical protein H0H87_001298 [Tephrocybe sp. NHM501043]